MDDDDAFLYGDSNDAPPSPRVGASDVKAVLNGNTQPTAEPAQDDEDGEVAMDEEESDDDIEITLEADPNAPAPAQTGFRYPAFIRQPGAAQPAVISAPHAQNAYAAAATQKAPEVPVLRPPSDLQPGITPPPMSLTASGMPRAEVEKPAVVDDGDLLLDVDIDDLPDQPWRRTGAVVSEYFNYGFDEATWKAYCARQKVSREERENERDNGYSVFATLPLQEAWDSLSMDNRTALLQTIATSFASTMPNGDAFGVKQEQHEDPGYGSPRPNAAFNTVPTGPRGRPPVPVRPASPLPENIPTGPKSARSAAPVPTGPRNQSSYRDSDLDGNTGKDDVLDYGNERSERDDYSPRSERRERSSRRARDDSVNGEEDDDRKGSRRSRRDSERDGDRRSRIDKEKSPGASKRRSRDDDDRDHRSSRTSSRHKDRSPRTKLEEAFGDESEEDHRSSKRTKR